MAKLNKFIEGMVQRHVERAVITSGQPIQLFMAGREIAGAVISQADLQSAVQEITPEGQQDELRWNWPFHFSYNFQEQTFLIQVETIGEALQVCIEPFQEAAPVVVPHPLMPVPAFPQPSIRVPPPAPPSRRGSIWAFIGLAACLLLMLGGYGVFRMKKNAAIATDLTSYKSSVDLLLSSLNRISDFAKIEVVSTDVDAQAIADKTDIGIQKLKDISPTTPEVQKLHQDLIKIEDRRMMTAILVIANRNSAAAMLEHANSLASRDPIAASIKPELERNAEPFLNQKQQAGQQLAQADKDYQDWLKHRDEMEQ
jgi:hypothetical protein